MKNYIIKKMNQKKQIIQKKGFSKTTKNKRMPKR